MQDIIWLIQNRLWVEPELIEFMDKHDNLIFQIQDLAFKSCSRTIRPRPYIDDVIPREEFQVLFLELRNILKNETGTNPDEFSESEIYWELVHPIVS